MKMKMTLLRDNIGEAAPDDVDEAEASGARRWSFECFREDTNESHDWKSCKPGSDQEVKLVLPMVLFIYGTSHARRQNIP